MGGEGACETSAHQAEIVRMHPPALVLVAGGLGRPCSRCTHGAGAHVPRSARALAAGEILSPAEAARKTVASLLPRAVAPAGFILVPDCPPLETAQQRRALVGRRLLHGWDDGVRHGWFVGRVMRSGVTPGDLRQVPTANFVVRYAAQQTGGELNGLVACELSPRTHGVDQWWVLLE